MIGDFCIVDTHMHFGRYEGIPYISIGFEQVLSLARAAGTDAHIFVSTFEQLVPPPVSAEHILRGNEELLYKVSAEPDCWMMAVFNPTMPDVIHQVEQLLKEKKCLGIKCGPSYHQYDIAGPAGRTIFEFLATHDAAAVIHTNPNEYDHPERILPWAEKYPEARVLLAHYNSLHPHTRHAELLREHDCPNVWLGYDHCDCIRYGLLDTCVDLIGAERIIYGSDMPCYYVKPMIEGVLSSGLSETEKRLILAENAERFLKKTLGENLHAC